MFEIDVYTRTTANRPFAIKTYKADNASDLKKILSEQTAILRSKYTNPTCTTNGTFMQFKTNRGNPYAEIEVNRVSNQ